MSTEVQTEDIESREAVGRPMIRVSLDLTPSMKEVIDELARRSGTSKAVMLRDAIALFKLVKDAQDRGETAILVDKEGNLVARIVGA
jgi:predicted transcriptional regulator